MTPSLSCPRCERDIEPGDRFCGHCGAGVAPDSSAGAVGAFHEEGLIERLARGTLGKYEIRGEVGRGGMAMVFLAHDIRLGRKVAIKVLAPALQATPGMAGRFLREARTAASLEHPNIITIHDVGEVEGLVYFTMRFVHGRPLSSIVRRQGPMQIPLVQGIFAEVGAALSFAHRNGVLHRDVKPGNVLVGRDGSIVVTDFGIAKQAEEQGLTLTGQLLGTPGYMSPEQSRGQQVSAASDQYSLGALVFELVAGRPPFVGNNAVDVMARQLSEPVPDLLALRPDCPAELAGAVHRMLDREPGRRFDSIDAAVSATGASLLVASDPARRQLGDWAEPELSPAASSVTPVSKPPESARRNPGRATPPRGAGRDQPGVATPTPASGPRKAPVRRQRPWVGKAVVGAGALAVAVIAWVAFSGVPEGRLVVAGLPTGGVVFVDGVARPGADFVMTGRHEIRIEAPGFQPHVRVVVVDEGRTDTLRFDSQPLPPPPPETGTVEVIGLPPGGTVTVDGVRRPGSTFRLTPGRHSLGLQAPGFRPSERAVVVVAGRTDSLRFTGERVVLSDTSRPPPVINGVLLLRVRPFARIYVDGSFAIEDEQLIRSLRPGRHRLRFVKDGFQTKDSVVTVLPGDTVRVRFTLERTSP